MKNMKEKKAALRAAGWTCDEQICPATVGPFSLTCKNSLVITRNSYQSLKGKGLGEIDGLFLFFFYISPCYKQIIYFLP